jgi:hypothetical protein
MYAIWLENSSPLLVEQAVTGAWLCTADIVFLPATTLVALADESNDLPSPPLLRMRAAASNSRALLVLGAEF